jgi:hypothetical protein
MLLLAWIFVVAVCGVAAAATHDDDDVATTSSSSTTSTSSTSTTAGVDAGTTGTTVAGQTTTTKKASGTGATGTTVDTSPPSTPQRIMPDTGTYTLAVTGSASLNGGTPQPAPPSATYKITQTSATDQHQTGDFELDLRWTPESASLLKLTLKQGGNALKTFQPATPLLYTPFPGTVGRTWSWTVKSTDGKTTVSQVSNITKTEAVVIAGRSEPAFVVHTVLTLTGDVKGSVDLTSWMSSIYRVALRQHVVVDATYLGFHATSDTTGQLVSVSPA